jgi:hypothetical protein
MKIVALYVILTFCAGCTLLGGWDPVGGDLIRKALSAAGTSTRPGDVQTAISGSPGSARGSIRRGLRAFH